MMKTISELYNKYLNSDKACVILGCGSSAKEFQLHPKIHTIGVNDIGLITNVDTLLLVDNKRKFKNDWNERGEERVANIEKTIAEHYIIMDDSWEFPVEKKYFFKLGDMYRLNKNMDNNEKLNYANDSPYMAINLAYKMGFRKIGILGVDYTPNHFYAKDGDHQLVRVNLINKVLSQYDVLKRTLEKTVTFYNLSKNSKLIAFPKITYDEFTSKL